MQGASAIEDLLKSMPDRDLRVFVVWEPVLDSDTGPPGDKAQARVTDPRARQYWDAKLRLSEAARKTLLKDPAPVIGKESLVTGEIVWDFIALFPPGVTWKGDFPVPAFKGAPVVDVIPALRKTLLLRDPTVTNR
ncbi:MAG TPA: hypothetical protein DEH78_21505 [Solibacterales bacterium]|nr:hypothetical protein [Bryobacterales bacterium]